MTDGAVTSSYGKDRDVAVRVLNQALATEIVCVLRYKRHAFMAQGPNSEPIAAEFHTHASEEQAHADQIAERIVQLGGEPDFSVLEKDFRVVGRSSNSQISIDNGRQRRSTQLLNLRGGLRLAAGAPGGQPQVASGELCDEPGR